MWYSEESLFHAVPHSEEFFVQIFIFDECFFETALGHESGDPGELFAKKPTEGQKSRDCTFKGTLGHSYEIVCEIIAFNYTGSLGLN
jgi:hypothetical protein